MVEKKCAKPKCDGETLRKIELESSWTIEKYYCPKCGHQYIVPTNLGKTAQVAPIALVSVAGVKILYQLLADDHASFEDDDFGQT